MSSCKLQPLQNVPKAQKTTPFLEYFEPQWIGKVVTQRQAKARAKASWNVYWVAVNGELKTTLALEAYHKHLMANFGLHPKFNKFFSLLQHRQEKTISKLCDLASRVPPTKPTTHSTLFTKAIQGAATHKSRPLSLISSLSLFPLPSWKGLE
ncbi:hypothetical protein DSO57_1008669 [Entomophthora muscae]|uniref:Uncharacterized protein n=1 Tax=Entomophthora muscae TaxID=34485 RepID=A0ACC2T7E4_9FUNG|nr:hypothetical protein DSO57_1008669 [Entomophthora muscae]